MSQLNHVHVRDLEAVMEEKTNIEIVDFKKKDSIDKASSKLIESAKKETVKYVNEELDVENSLMGVEEGDDVIGELDSVEIDMFKQMAGIGVQIKKDLDIYQEQANNNLKRLFKDDPDKLSMFLLKKAISDDIDHEVSNRICRNKDLYELLRKTMFWRIQERTQVFDRVISVRKGFKLCATNRIHIMQVDEAVGRVKKMQALQELEKSNHPMKHMIKQMIESENFF